MLIKYSGPSIGNNCINFSQVFSFQQLANKIYFYGMGESDLKILDFLSEEEAKQAFEKIMEMADWSTAICDLNE